MVRRGRVSPKTTWGRSAPALDLFAAARDHLERTGGAGGTVITATEAELAPLTAAEAGYLDAHSGADPDVGYLDGARALAVVEEAAERERALTTGAVAELLGVDPSTVRHHLLSGAIYALPSAGAGSPRGIPAWQFAGNRPLPGMAEVLAALPDGLDPLTLRDFFARATVEASDGAAIGVVEWLASGGPVESVVELASSMDGVA